MNKDIEELEAELDELKVELEEVKERNQILEDFIEEIRDKLRFI